MTIQQFTTDVIDNYKLFFMLQKLNANSGDISLLYKEVGADVPFEDYSLFEMNNGHLLVAFDHEYKYQNKHNLIATNGDISEIINLQSFERIYKYYKLGVDSEEHGGFTFMNSAPVPSFDNQWRCDAGLFGVEFFTDPTGGSLIEIPDESDELLVYEPIFSLNGTAHLIYTERKNKTSKFELMNNSVTPFAAYSLGESIKLITEWSKVSEEPFGNTEDIAIKSYNFINEIGLSERLVSNQPDMQIFEYLKGNSTARLRPDGAQLLLEDLNSFVKKNISHMSLSHIVSLYPESWDIQEILSKEAERFPIEISEFLIPFIGSEVTLALGNRTNILSLLLEKTGEEGFCKFVNMKFDHLESKNIILTALQSNPSHIF